MKTKWEWIEDACRELNNEEAADIAKEINKILVRIYGRKHTEDWRELYKLLKTKKRVDMLEIVAVASDVFSCIACKEDRICETCRFGKYAGICNEDGSLVTKFFDALGVRE